MSNPPSGASLIAESLAVLSDARQDPIQISDRAYGHEISPNEVVMTSMGTRRKAMITPYFMGMEFEHKLPTRIFRAQAACRPLVEAVIGFRSSATHCLYLASVTLRLGMFNDPERSRMTETVWSFPLPFDSVPGETTWDVVDAIEAAAENGVPARNRSGAIAATPERLAAGNWAISEVYDPTLAAVEINYAIANEISFVRF